MNNNPRLRQSLKVIISEAAMVLGVILLVVVLALIVSGYWVNSDFEVQRQGMIQVASTPTGADLSIDGESSWLQRTNTSKMLSSGEHSIVITKDGYDTWSKTVEVSEGLLYRIHYPRLFWQDRKPESALSTTGTTIASVSPDGDTLLLMNTTTSWQVVKLDNDTLKPQKIDISNYFSNVSMAEGAEVGVFTGEVLDADWDRNGDHILIKTKQGDTVEWTILDVNNIKNSINLTKEFGANFTDVKILDNSSSNLLAVQNGNLHKIDVPSKIISAVLVENVVDFDHYENEIIFSAQAPNGKYKIGLFKIGDKKVKELETMDKPAKVVISKFYDDMYIATLDEDRFALYKKDDYSEIMHTTLGFKPQHIKVGHDGEFITMWESTQIATLDMETASVVEWSTEGENFDWLGHDMIFSVSDGELIVYDFDGLNRRILAKNVSDHFPVIITDDKWLYYFSDDKLIREWIVEH